MPQNAQQPESLNILIVEDSQDDADLVVRQLRKESFQFKWTRVQTERDFMAELKKTPDIILSDYSMPQFSGFRAMELVRKSGLEIPFILISGTLGEDVAVEAIKIGAADYLLKDRLARLGQAVERALREAKERAGRRKLEAHILQAQKMESIGQLAGGVAHDFNNILAIIQMQTELLRNTKGVSADQIDIANEVKTTVQRGAALTRQLLLFSRREVFQPRKLNLNEPVGNTTKILQRILGENIQMEVELASQPVYVRADAGMIDQVLMNLTVNARDAMPRGGRLMIETFAKEFDELATSQSLNARPGSFVCLSVSDSGCGIAPEIIPRIFEPFFTTKGVGEGTGLGLATVFGIVQQHQGWVDVQSEVGRGTTFRVYFPRLGGETEGKVVEPALSGMRGGNETILLAEDDPSLRASIRNVLTQLGYRILEAPTGAKAVEVWEKNRDEIILLLTDLVMPGGMTGKELAHVLLQKTSKLKVVYMSGYSAEVAGDNFPLEDGVNFLIKPFQAEKLAATIRARLDQR